MPKHWDIVYTNRFEKQYGGKPQRIKDKVGELITRIENCDDPKSFGEKKKNLDFYAVDLSDSDRIAYGVNEKSNAVTFVRVCNHKQVYGKG